MARRTVTSKRLWRYIVCCMKFIFQFFFWVIKRDLRLGGNEVIVIDKKVIKKKNKTFYCLLYYRPAKKKFRSLRQNMRLYAY